MEDALLMGDHVNKVLPILKKDLQSSYFLMEFQAKSDFSQTILKKSISNLESTLSTKTCSSQFVLEAVVINWISSTGQRMTKQEIFQSVLN